MADFYEFFAGGGMARQGLGRGWTCRFANDFDVKKGSAYRNNFGGQDLFVGDVREVTTARLPGFADLVWGSFPCQDLSLAGGGAGLNGGRSGTFYPFWDVMNGLVRERRAPTVIALENVCGALTSHGGADFEAIVRTYARAGYRVGALVVDAALFVPQSRPQLFFVGIRADIEIDPDLLATGPTAPFHPKSLQRTVAGLPAALRDAILWLRLPAPPHPRRSLADLIEEDPGGVWRTAAETRRLLAMMSPINKAKLEAATKSGRRMIGGVYKRTRVNDNGAKTQRAEVRFDDMLGCLRTPAGGSSRQTIIVVQGRDIRSRLITARETARLMGLPEGYKLPDKYNDAYHLTGDGVVVPVVRHLAEHIFEPLVAGALDARRRVA